MDHDLPPFGQPSKPRIPPPLPPPPPERAQTQDEISDEFERRRYELELDASGLAGLGGGEEDWEAVERSMGRDRLRRTALRGLAAFLCLVFAAQRLRERFAHSDEPDAPEQPPRTPSPTARKAAASPRASPVELDDPPAAAPPPAEHDTDDEYVSVD